MSSSPKTGTRFDQTTHCIRVGSPPHLSGLAAGAVAAEDAAALAHALSDAQRRCEQLSRAHGLAAAALATAEAERTHLLHESEALGAQCEQLQAAADTAQRALDMERSKRQALAEEMYQRERIVQMLCSENEVRCRCVCASCRRKGRVV